MLWTGSHLPETCVERKMFNFDKLVFIFRLFKVVIDYGQQIAALDRFCFAINPKQPYLYKFMYCEQIGGLKQYGTVNRAPALAFQLNLNHLEARYRRRIGLFKIFCQGQTPAEDLHAPVQLSPNDLAYLFVKRSDIFARATPAQVAYLKRCYPATAHQLNRLFSTSRNGRYRAQRHSSVH